MPSAPQLSPQQRELALGKAAEARTVRALARAELKAGQLGLAELFERAEAEQPLATMRVTALLESLPGYGKVRAGQLLTELRIAASRRVRGLGPNQRAALLARIEHAAQSRT